MEGPKIKLNVLGITFSQVQAGAYAMVLAEEGGSRRVPIIIGTPEAQSIAIFLEGLHPPRPLTHDLFISFSKALNVKLEEINIYKFEEGVFFSELVFSQGGNRIVIDSRTSDAIALAIRTDAPIYTTEAIMQEAAIILEDDDNDDMEENEPTVLSKTDYESMNLEELQENLADAIEREDYENASHLRDLIKRLRKG